MKGGREVGEKYVCEMLMQLDGIGWDWLTWLVDPGLSRSVGRCED